MLVLRVRKTVRLDHLAFAPDGRVLVGCGDFGAYLWRDLGTDQRPEHIAPDSWATFARFTSDGRFLFLAGHNLVRRDVQSGSEEKVKLWTEYNIRFDLSPDGTRLIVAQWVYNPHMNCEMRVKCLSTDNLKAKPIWECVAPDADRIGPLFLPDGERFVWYSGAWVDERRRIESHIVTYSATTGKEVNRSEVFTELVDVSILSSDAHRFAGRYQRHVYIWELEPRAKRVAHIENDSKKYFTGVGFHPSGKFVAVTSNDQTVKLYDTTTWQLSHTFTWKIGKMRSVCFSPDGTLAAAGSDTGKVVIWDVDV